MKLIQVPFQGFYCSIPSEQIDDVVERDCGELSDSLRNEIDFSYNNEMLVGYCKLYLEGVVKELDQSFSLDIDLTFKGLVSPREYNFETDRIFALISDSDLLALFDRIEKEVLENAIKDRCTSRDGFISFYSNDLKDWPESILEWDSVQLEFLLDVLLSESETFEHEAVNDENGDLSDLVWGGYSDESKVIIDDHHEKQQQA